MTELNYIIWKCMKCGQKTVKMDFLAKKVTITNKNCKNLRSFASQVF